jgi:carboxypeptidase C (cathepsin A)
MVKDHRWFYNGSEWNVNFDIIGKETTVAKKAKKKTKEKRVSSSETDEKPSEEKRILLEEHKTSHHVVSVDNEEIAYTATTGTLLLKDELGNEPKASIFYVAYTRDDIKDINQRP